MTTENTLRELETQLVAARAENEALRKTGLELAHVIDGAGRCGCPQCMEMEHRVLAALRAQPDDGRVAEERGARIVLDAMEDRGQWGICDELYNQKARDEFIRRALGHDAAADGNEGGA